MLTGIATSLNRKSGQKENSKRGGGISLTRGMKEEGEISCHSRLRTKKEGKVVLS